MLPFETTLPILGQIMKYLTSVELEEGWMKYISHSEGQSSSHQVDFRFTLCCSVLKPECVRGDQSQQQRPNFALFDPCKI